MKALVKERPGPGLSLLDIRKPEIKNPDDVLFKVEYCGICVGEVKVYDWSGWAASDSTLELPTVLGHEVAAVVAEVGSGVKDFAPGDRITVDVFIHCGRCYQCRTGHSNVCANREIYGKRRGAYAEYAVLPERVLCKVPDKLSMQEVALLENLGVAVHAVEHVAHDPGDVAVIIGCGPIGILAAQSLAAQGVNVVLTDMVGPRLALAGEISGGSVIDVNKEDPVQKITDMTNGKGADFVFEAAGSQSALDQAFDVVRTRGTIVTIGTFGEPVTFNPFFKMTRREVRLVSSIGRTWETWRRMIQLIESGSLNLKPLITKVLPIEKYREGFEMVKSQKVMKVLLQP
jgi:2-desacetyl-2-hydroxyethyl bacteriochlorophyllide A dehydrogenase